MTLAAQNRPPNNKTLILGVGNPLQGDDGAGIRAAEMLAERELPADVKVQEAGMPGWGLPAWLEGWSSVIIVDAVQMGQAPGTWRRFDLDDVRLIADDNIISLHQPDLANGLALAQALDMLPEKIVFYGIEPACIDHGQGLSPAVSLNLPGLVESVLYDLGKREA